MLGLIVGGCDCGCGVGECVDGVGFVGVLIGECDGLCVFCFELDCGFVVCLVVK